jgi:uncharacterized protein (TIGR02284 family)
MQMTDEELIPHLNDLIQVSEDGLHGYTTAAETVSNSELRSIFSGYASQRSAFIRDLSVEVARLGGTPVASGTLTEAVHRGWIDIKSLLSGGSSGALVAACETGDDSAKAAFERVVNLDITGKSRWLVESQFNKISEAHQHMLHLTKEMADGVEFPKDL